MAINTHQQINNQLCGQPILVENNRSQVELQTLPEMAADARGLVHGGFVFSLADYAAMLAVNEANVVLGSADTRFLMPVKVGDKLVAEAELQELKGRKHMVAVKVRRGSEEVLSGTFTCFVTEKHVLDK